MWQQNLTNRQCSNAPVGTTLARRSTNSSFVSSTLLWSRSHHCIASCTNLCISHAVMAIVGATKEKFSSICISSSNVSSWPLLLDMLSSLPSSLDLTSCSSSLGIACRSQKLIRANRLAAVGRPLWMYSDCCEMKRDTRLVGHHLLVFLSDGVYDLLISFSCQ